MNIRFPKAELLAETMPLPMTVCPVTKELYGTAVPILDEAEARTRLYLADVRGPAMDVALDILRERVECCA